MDASPSDRSPPDRHARPDDAQGSLPASGPAAVHRPGRRSRRLGAAPFLTVLLPAVALAAGSWRGPARQEIPRVWTEEGLKDFELPPPLAEFTVQHVTPEYYYTLPERVIHRTYPVFHPDFEPPGYLDSLRSRGSATALDTDTLDTDEEWIRAGEMVFDAPIIYFQLDPNDPFQAAGMAAAGVPVDADGTFPFARYAIVDGEVKMGVAACGNCHTRVLPDGSVLKAVQGNFPLNTILARFLAGLPPAAAQGFLTGFAREQFGAPWVGHASQTMMDTLSVDRAVALFAALPGGVFTRQGTGWLYPAKIPDLRGVRHQRFLDATGLVQQRSIGDLMRYASFTQFLDHLSRFGDFVPSIGTHEGPLPPPDSVESFFNGPFTRFTDAQLYALAQYLYALDPLPSPHGLDDDTRSLGERVFAEEGCVTCHPPPDFTINELTPALGFEPPEDHYDRWPIFDISVETDPGLALYTRRGTGYYKVPSLRGLWYRERLFHDGSLTLEEVLDPARLSPDFVPSGPPGATPDARAVPGHPFGLELGPRERAALVAYLRTL
jgi:mono/diheme cytochrome c family protein